MGIPIISFKYALSMGCVISDINNPMLSAKRKIG